MTDFLSGILAQIQPQLIDLTAVLVVALLVQGLRYAGIVVNANTQAEIDTHTRKAILIVNEENARRLQAGEPAMTSSEKATMARDYILARLNENRNRLISFALGRIFKSFSLPSDATIALNIDSELAPMGEGATMPKPGSGSGN
jgi:hypothetical protein